MDLMPTAEQAAIKDSVRAFLTREVPIARVREIALEGPGTCAGLWRDAAGLGFFGLGLAEEQGGAGYSITEEMVLFEELGRALAPGPWLGSVLAAHALAGERELAGQAREVLGGELRVALVDDCNDRDALVLQEDRGGARLSGERTLVADADGAGAFLLLDRTGVLFVPLDRAAVAIAPQPSLDLTRPIANLAFRSCRCFVLTRDPASVESLRRAATVLACAEAVGAIERTVEMSVEYAKVRQQFGKPIGSFQAVKHRCADMAVRAEVARSATTYAAVSVRDAAADVGFQTRVAKILAANAFIANAADNVQNHGGMGFTWECDAHLFVKRARSFDLNLGSRTRELDALVAEIRAA
jgi:alkylation response protein AidB-like acyl-CoA dehydrogenase